ncbi:zinc finger protein 271-like [Cloeon dipterum]|uniref:zinc finger protein 271-like n=1 Tax=Cloeon dipterum TaxID=197152 RepID=UPI00321F7F12
MSDACKACGDLQSNVPANVLFHSFPADLKRRSTWEEKCKKGSTINPLSSGLTDGQNWAVCSRHFRKDDYITISDDIHFLKPIAVPSIFGNVLTGNISETANVSAPIQEIKVMTGTEPIVVGDKRTNLKVTQITEKDKNYYKPFDKASEAHNWRCRCRICGKIWSASVLCNIFSDRVNKASLADKINSCLPVKVLSTDEVPTKICKQCMTKIDEFHTFRQSAKNADLEFIEENNRFKLVKALEAQANILKSLPSQLQHDVTKASTATTAVSINVIENKPEYNKNGVLEQSEASTRRRKRKSNPAEDEPLKRVKIFRLQGSKAKKAKGVHVKTEAGDEEEIEGEVGASNSETSLEEEVKITPRTRRFNLRSAPKPNVIFTNMGYPSELKKTQRSAGPSILRKTVSESPELKELVPPDLPPELEEVSEPRKKRESRLKGRKPRSKRYFVTRKIYGDRIINQKCDFKGCQVISETVHKYLQHRYLQHDESNFSFCKVCSQVYETKPRNMDNGHRHLPESCSMPVVSVEPTDEQTYRCDECSREFTDKGKLIQHNKSKHGCYNCGECGKKFKVLYEFKKHVQDHIFTKGGVPLRGSKKKNNTKFNCELCKENNASFVQLQAHVLRSHDQDFQFLPCDCCSSIFYTEQLLRLHKELRNSEEVQLCENCGSTFTTATEMRNHKKACITITNKPVACKLCNIFVHPNKMHTHMNWHVTQENPERCQKCLLILWSSCKHNCKLYRCEACQLSFNGYPKFLSHKRSHVSKDAMYYCNICEIAKFSSFDDLVAHFKVHSQVELRQSQIKYISNFPMHRICQEPNCLEVLHKNTLRKHRNNKHTVKAPPKLSMEEVLTCPSCNEVLPGVNEYIDHRMNHTEPYELPCSHCDLKFDSETRRTIHIMRCHSETSRVTCDTCKRVFNSMQKLRVHIMRHIKYKPYVCRYPNCKAAYYLFGDWRKHSMLHVGLNPNYCKLCNKQFMKAETLTAHNKKWHPEGEPKQEKEELEEVEKVEEDIIYQCSKCTFRDRAEMVVIEHLERDHAHEEEESCEKVLLELASGEAVWQ